jgi:TM2 domain-containing membrane protein YozV
LTSYTRALAKFLFDSAHTARHLYNNCLTSDKLMAGRTRIMVTHALHLTIPLADYMVALANGYVAFDGPAVDYIVASGANTPGLALGQDFSSLNLRSLETGLGKPPIPLDIVGDAAAEQAFEQSLPHLDEDPLNQEPLLSKAEKASTGAVSFGIYTFYGKAYGSATVIISLVALIVITEAVSIGTNWYLRLWASSFDRIVHTVRTIVSDSFYQQDYVDHLPDYYLKRYVTFAAASLILFGARMRRPVFFLCFLIWFANPTLILHSVLSMAWNHCEQSFV